MGIFHKVIKDAIKACRDNNFKLARQIINQHLSEEHTATSRMSGLSHLVGGYINDLKMAEWKCGGRSKTSRQDAIDALNRARSDLLQIASLLKLLLKEELAQ